MGLRAEVDEGLEGAPTEGFWAGTSASPMSHENRGPFGLFRVKIGG